MADQNELARGIAVNVTKQNIIGWAYDSTTSGKRQGTYMAAESWMRFGRNKMVYNWNPGVGTGITTDLIRNYSTSETGLGSVYESFKPGLEVTGNSQNSYRKGKRLYIANSTTEGEITIRKISTETFSSEKTTVINFSKPNGTLNTYCTLHYASEQRIVITLNGSPGFLVVIENPFTSPNFRYVPLDAVPRAYAGGYDVIRQVTFGTQHTYPICCSNDGKRLYFGYANVLNAAENGTTTGSVKIDIDTLTSVDRMFYSSTTIVYPYFQPDPDDDGGLMFAGSSAILGGRFANAAALGASMLITGIQESDFWVSLATTAPDASVLASRVRYVDAVTDIGYTNVVFLGGSLTGDRPMVCTSNNGGYIRRASCTLSRWWETLEPCGVKSIFTPPSPLVKTYDDNLKVEVSTTLGAPWL